MSTTRNVSKKVVPAYLNLPEQPKRPVTPFLEFSNKMLKNYASSNLPHSEVRKIISSKWNDISEEEKMALKEEYKKSYAKYKEDLQNYENSLTDEQKKSIEIAEKELKLNQEQKIVKNLREKRSRDLDKPKKPLTSFFKFKQAQKKKDNESILEFSQRIGKMWKSLSDKDKAEFTKNYNNEIKNYNDTLLEWEYKMIKLGNLDVVRSITLKDF
ncbi:transcription factor A, putative [Pediculus humanus corporis]|uniref:Transcription factor A, putative n=1 Tax=Pediculus humanus subsp. corporis TaxID=121224 RepID=E0VE36_PEDHC|nr:transcription factor A, putative [Pediculus humanus corporis]EEB11642.1 transcription factor A, putative [Pediculus humanus corporis]